jgi:hypothetical protein
MLQHLLGMCWRDHIHRSGFLVGSLAFRQLIAPQRLGVGSTGMRRRAVRAGVALPVVARLVRRERALL